MTTKWKLPQSYIDRFNNPTERSYSSWNNNFILNSVQIATVDGLLPNSNNIDLIESYIEINNQKYYFVNWEGLISGSSRMSIVNDNLKLNAFISPPFPCGLVSSGYKLGFTGILANGYYPRLSVLFNIDSYNEISIDIDVNTTPYIIMDVVPTTIALVDSITIDEIVIGNINIDPRTIPVLNNGNALPINSVVRNTVTGQKFLKVAGSPTAFMAIEVTPLVEWAWDQSAIDAWAVLQGF